MRKITIVLIALVFILSACLPGQSQEDIEGRVNTAVAQTMESQNQINLSVQQTLDVLNGQGGGGDVPDESFVIFTDTPFVIVTDTPFVIVTDTPFQIITDTPRPVTNTPIPDFVSSDPATPQPYGCFVSTINPDYGEDIKAGSKFEIRWQVKNTGTKAWPSGIDIKYASGPKFTNAERVEIPKALAPGESYKISMTGTAPKNTGLQRVTWIVEGNLCYANVDINVK